MQTELDSPLPTVQPSGPITKLGWLYPSISVANFKTNRAEAEGNKDETPAVVCPPPPFMLVSELLGLVVFPSTALEALFGEW
mmetsp:Transcript_18176/g.23521  ORF Transcript_18176/g.23521 Transcript_18176/m.23521 type:complete len:82 (+) Transcript_18176:1603-1848(+)